MTESELLEAGYIPHQRIPESPKTGRWYQKPIRSGKSILYFINIEEYQFGYYRYDVTAYLHQSSGPSLRVMIVPEPADLIESIEDEFTRIYRQLDCIPDPLNND